MSEESRTRGEEVARVLLNQSTLKIVLWLMVCFYSYHLGYMKGLIAAHVEVQDATPHSWNIVHDR